MDTILRFLFKSGILNGLTAIVNIYVLKKYPNYTKNSYPNYIGYSIITFNLYFAIHNANKFIKSRNC